MPSALHLAEQLPAAWPEVAGGVGALRVDAGTVVRRSDGAQPLRVGALEVRQRHDRVGPLEAQHVPDAWLPPSVEFRSSGSASSNQRTLRPAATCRSSAARSAIGVSSPRSSMARYQASCPCVIAQACSGRVPSGQRVVRRDVPGDQRRDAQPDAAAAHLRKRHRAAAAIRLVGPRPLARADLVDRPRQIAVPLERVHREVEVRVDNQHGQPTTRPSSSTPARPATR